MARGVNSVFWLQGNVPFLGNANDDHTSALLCSHSNLVIPLYRGETGSEKLNKSSKVMLLEKG
jgi:hypothetical protein